jgi:ferric-dicitrate binding protein FerR (iron transport regulator)
MDDELFDKYLSGSLTPEEERRLARLLEEDPEAGKALVRHVRETSLLVQVASQLRAATPEGGRRPATRRSFRRRLFRRAPIPWTAAGVAAAAFLALTLLVLLPPSRPARDPGRDEAAAGRPPEERLREIRQKEEELAAPSAAPPDSPAGRKREEERASLREERERIEREMREHLERTRRPEAPAPPPPSRPPEAPAPTPPPQSPKPSPSESRAAVAVLREVSAEAYVVTDTGKAPAVAGQSVLAGQGLETGATGRAVVEYADRTRLELRGRASFGRERPKQVTQVRGIVTADVARQPGDEPMRFLSAHAEATVLGTTLRLIVDEASTRLEVTGGRVRLKRLSDGKAVEVTAGYFAVAATGVELVARPLPIDEIVLRPPQGKAFGTDWRGVADAGASSALAWEVPHQRTWKETEALQKERPLPHLVLTFSADADKDYHVWIRGRCVAQQDRLVHDAIVLEAPGASVSQPAFDTSALGSRERALFSGWGNRDGYFWIGGRGDEEGDRVPVTVRFSRPGNQALRLFGFETPMRIDTVWLSATQKTRPADAQTGPAGK